MEPETFKKIIDGIKKAWGGGGALVKKLRLFKIGEPLLNKNIVEMVRYAKEKDCAECIEITTNGTLLDHELSDGLIDAGLDILNISVNGINSRQYEENCNYSINYDRFVSDIRYFYEHRKNCKVFIKLGDTGYTREERDLFYRMFEECCDEIFIEGISSSLWQDTGIGEVIPELHDGLYGQEKIRKKVCPFLFTTLVINHEGIAHLCCADWKSEYILGDLKKETIDKVWNGKKLQNVRCLHLCGQKESIQLCKACESPDLMTTDNLDDYAGLILDKIRMTDTEDEDESG